MDDAVRNLVIGSIVLVLAALYGGQTLGSWFYVSGDIEDDPDESIEFTANFNLKGWEYEVIIEDDGDKDEQVVDQSRDSLLR